MIACPSCNTGYDDDSTRYCGRCGSDMKRAPGGATEAGGDPLLGRVIDERYRIRSKLGRGGMGAVYRVERVAMGRHAAMKRLPPALTQDVEAGRRSRREAEAVLGLWDGNIVAGF